MRGERAVREYGSEPEEVSGSLERAKEDEDIAERGVGGGREGWWGRKREKKSLGAPE